MSDIHFVAAQLNGHSRSFEVIYFSVSEKRKYRSLALSQKIPNNQQPTIYFPQLKQIQSEHWSIQWSRTL